MLSPDEVAIWRVAAQTDAAVRVADLPAILEIPAVAVAPMVDSLVAAGELVLWDRHPRGRAVMLAPTTARRLGLVLVRIRGIEYRWVESGSPEAKEARSRDHRKARRVETDLRGRDGKGGFDALVDALAVNTLAIRDDEDETAPTGPRGVRPRLLYGIRESWPVVHRPGETCRVCPPGRQLHLHEYCLCCDRAKGEVPRPPAQRESPTVPPRYRPRADGLAGGIGRPPGRRVPALNEKA